MTNYRADIDGLRALAVLFVLVFHAWPSVLPAGTMGVDIFFVISGYLITKIILTSLRDGKFSFLEFYARRIRRIFPALIVTLVVSMMAGWLLMTPREYELLGSHIAGGAGFFLNFQLVTEAGYFDVSTQLKPLTHLWSLSVEEQLYLIIPVLLYLSWRGGRNEFKVIVGLLALSFAANIRYLEYREAAFYLLYGRGWEFLVGSVIAYKEMFPAPESGNSDETNVLTGESGSNMLSAAGLFLIAVGLIFVKDLRLFPGWLALLPVVGAALVILSGRSSWIGSSVLGSKALVSIGVISYPLYLWHWSLLSFAKISQRGSISELTSAMLVVVSFPLAYLTYQYVEKPLRFGGKGKIKALGLLLAMVLVATCGVVVWKLDGLSMRFPAKIRPAADYRYDLLADGRYRECWLEKKAPADGFSPQCIDPAKSDDKSPLVIVWGDSFAARLFPGIRAVIGGNARLGQLSRDACMPIVNVGYAQSNCLESNDFVMAVIRNERPNTVVLHADWRSLGKHGDSKIDPTSPITNYLLDTIQQLKKNGVNNIVFVGPTPSWSENLPDLLIKNWLSHKTEEQLPNRTNVGLTENLRELDASLRDLITTRTSASYVSAMELLCNADGCLTYVPDDSRDFFTPDVGHLTTHGAIYLSKKLPLAN